MIMFFSGLVLLFTTIPHYTYVEVDQFVHMFQGEGIDFRVWSCCLNH